MPEAARHPRGGHAALMAIDDIGAIAAPSREGGRA